MLAYRYLFEQMVRREVRSKYKGAAPCGLWYPLKPPLLLAPVSLMFGTLLDAVDIPDYLLFLFLGLIVWTFFSQSLLAASSSLVDQASLVSTVRFPRETVPASVVTVQLVPFGVLLLAVIPIAVIVR